MLIDLNSRISRGRVTYDMAGFVSCTFSVILCRHSQFQIGTCSNPKTPVFLFRQFTYVNIIVLIRERVVSRSSLKWVRHFAIGNGLTNFPVFNRVIIHFLNPFD